MKLHVFPICCWIIWFISFSILSSTFCIAADNEAHVITGDSEMIIIGENDLEMNNMFGTNVCSNTLCEFGEDCTNCPTDCGFCIVTTSEVVTGGGMSYTDNSVYCEKGFVPTIDSTCVPYRYYDVKLTTIRDKYLKSDEIVAQLNLQGFGNVPQIDGILSYYLVDNNGKKYDVKTEMIREGTHEKVLILNLPSDVTLGEWKIYAEWTIQNHTPLVIFDTFQVTSTWEKYKATVLITCIFLVIVIALFSIKVSKK